MPGLSRRVFVIVLAGVAAQCLVPGAVAASKKKTSSKATRHTRPGKKKPAARTHVPGPIKFDTVTPLSRLGGGRMSRVVNVVRQARGRPDLRLHSGLQRVAAAQARLMAGKDEMSHHLSGRSITERARRAGYRGKPAENLARQYETLEDVLTAWLYSPDHRTTLLSKRYRYFGLAGARTAARRNSKYKIYWAMVLGT